jgi:hypothetical protein
VDPLTRRGALGLLAAAASLSWGEAAAVGDQRVRPGAPLHLACVGADAFRLAWDTGAPRTFAAADGRLRMPAPRPRSAAGFATLTCTPLLRGAPCGAAAQVSVLAEPVGYGA